MANTLLSAETDKLRQYYKTLSWFGRLFFPGKLKQALTTHASPLDITQAAFSSTWFFQRWFFKGLRDFFQSKIIQSYQAGVDVTSLPKPEKETYREDDQPQHPEEHLDLFDPEENTPSFDPSDPMANVRAHYQPRLNALRGVASRGGRDDPAFQAVLTALRARYQQNPAHIQSNGQDVILPLNWADFDALPLDWQTRQRATVAYYQHKTHTALRLLNGPNEWGYGSSAPLEGLEPLIALLWLAASDESADMAPTNGYTLDDRINQFIDELALIGRARNWQSSGYNRESDNLQPDSPNCGGMASVSLQQSVQGHPLLTGLTQELILQTLREFVREHFRTTIQQLTPNGRVALNEALEEAMINPDGVRAETRAQLAALNVSPGMQANFLQQMNHRYGRLFTSQPVLSETIRTQFQLTARYPSHVMRFAGDTNLMPLLKAAIDADAVAPPRGLVTPTAGTSPLLRHSLLSARGLPVAVSDTADHLITTWIRPD